MICAGSRWAVVSADVPHSLHRQEGWENPHGTHRGKVHAWAGPRPPSTISVFIQKGNGKAPARTRVAGKLPSQTGHARPLITYDLLPISNNSRPPCVHFNHIDYGAIEGLCDNYEIALFQHYSYISDICRRPTARLGAVGPSDSVGTVRMERPSGSRPGQVRFRQFPPRPARSPALLATEALVDSQGASFTTNAISSSLPSPSSPPRRFVGMSVR